MGKRVVYGLKADEGLIPDGWTTSDYLRACIKAYKKWAYVTKGLKAPKGVYMTVYIQLAVKTFNEDYHLVMEDGKPVFYKNNNILPR